MGALDDLEAAAVAQGLASAKEIRDALRPRGRSKFSNKRAALPPALRAAEAVRLYDSTAERDRAAELRLMRDAGEIADLEEQPRLELERGVYYRPDFKYVDRRLGLVHEDVKGAEGERWRIIVHLWAIHGPTLLLVTKRARKRDGFRVVRTITPQPVGVRQLLASLRETAALLETLGVGDTARVLRAEARAYETGEVAGCQMG